MPSSQPKSWVAKLGLIGLGTLALGYFLGWTHGFVRIYNAGDDLLLEKNLIFFLLLGHLLADARPLRWTCDMARLAAPLAATALSVVGFASELRSVVAFSYVLFLLTSLALLMPRVNVRAYVFAITTMVILVMPAWLVMPPEPYTLQSMSAAALKVTLRSLMPDISWQNELTLVAGDTPIHIAESCDGGVFFRIAMAMAVYASLYTHSILRIVLRCLAAAVLSILLNWTRLIVIAFLTRHGLWEFALVSGHALIGHLTFMVGVGLIVWFSPLPDRWSSYIDQLPYRRKQS